MANVQYLPCTKVMGGKDADGLRQLRDPVLAAAMLLRRIVPYGQRRLEIQAAGLPEHGKLPFERAPAFQRPAASARLTDEREVFESERGEMPRGGLADRHVVADDVPDDVPGDRWIHVRDDGNVAFSREGDQLWVAAVGNDAGAAPLREIGVARFAGASHLDIDDPRRAQLDELEHALEQLPMRLVRMGHEDGHLGPVALKDRHVRIIAKSR